MQTCPRTRHLVTAFSGAVNHKPGLKVVLHCVQEKALAAAEKRRAETEIPADPAVLVEFFLNCSAEDIEFFIAKCKDNLDKQFFATLDSAIGRQRCVLFVEALVYCCHQMLRATHKTGQVTRTPWGRDIW